MALKLDQHGLRHTNGRHLISGDGMVNPATMFCPNGFGWSTSDTGHVRNDGTYGWTSLGNTHGTAAESYGTRYYKIYDHYGNTGPGSDDMQYLIYYNGDSNYANGGLYWLRMEFWYNSNPQRLSGFSCTCLNGEPVGLKFILDEDPTNEEVWVTGSRSWGSLFILRVAGQSSSGFNTNVCSWYNGGPLATNTGTAPSGTKIRGPHFTYDLEANSFTHYSDGETW